MATRDHGCVDGEYSFCMLCSATYSGVGDVSALRAVLQTEYAFFGLVFSGGLLEIVGV